MSCRLKLRTSPGRNKHAKHNHHPKATTNHCRLLRPLVETHLPNAVITTHSSRKLVIGTRVLEGRADRHPLIASHVFRNKGEER